MYYFCPMHCISFFRRLFIPAAIGIMVLFSACSPTKDLKDGQYFFTGYKIKTDNKSIDKELLHSYIRQKPNRKFFFIFRLQMGLYLMGKDKDSSWLKRIGEEPVILDTTLTNRSTNQLRSLMYRKGYFHAVVEDTIIYKKKRARVIYSIRPGEPYTIRNIEVTSADTGIYPRLIDERENSLIHSGMVYDEDILDAERERITDVLKSQGYYFFTKQFISYTADSALQSNQIDLKMKVSRLHEDTTGMGNSESHHQYYLNRIFIRTDYDPKSTTSPPYDTVSYKNYFFLINKQNPEQRFRKDVLLRTIFMAEDDLFNINDVKYSYSRLTDLNVFRFVNMRFDEVPRPKHQPLYLLDVNVLLTPSQSQDFTFETEGTHNAGNLGIAGNISYRNKNTFKGAEQLSLKLKGGLEFQKTISGNEDRTVFIFNTFEIGPEVSLNLKKLLLIHPLFRNASRKWNPRTRFSVSLNYQERPDYNRSILNFNSAWFFKTTLPHTFSFDFIDINSVNVLLSSSFLAKLNQINDRGLLYSYNDHLITSGRLNYTYNNKADLSRRNFDFFQANFEGSGLIPSLLDSSSVINIETDSLGFRKLFGLTYSQYIKVDLDYRHYQNFISKTIWAYRVYFGAGFPGKNSITLPFEKSFYAGGSNSLRGWRFRSLGPGSYVNTFNIDQTGDFKFEANSELRLPLVKPFEGAIFADAGNIWLLKEDNERIGGEIKWDSRLFTEIAIDAGLGIRLNFDYFIFRVDAAVQLRDPSRIESERWIYPREKFAASDINFNFGIGYPF